MYESCERLPLERPVALPQQQFARHHNTILSASDPQKVGVHFANLSSNTSQPVSNFNGQYSTASLGRRNEKNKGTAFPNGRQAHDNAPSRIPKNNGLLNSLAFCGAHGFLALYAYGKQH
mmetsp:Transcript_8010/g.14816  ORF Transcript_8010/g.14816 Transcript_8010/m.14816 type:complete len:119 (-) Transcript_8010:279-635(-)